jgi:hypothetical protein
MIQFKFNPAEVLRVDDRLFLQDTILRSKMDVYLKNDLYALLDGVFYTGVDLQIDLCDKIGPATKRELHSILGHIQRLAK